MQWFSQNWIWVLLFVAMIAMHLFGHGGHGGHGRHGSSHDEATPKIKDGEQAASEKDSAHKH